MNIELILSATNFNQVEKYKIGSFLSHLIINSSIQSFTFDKSDKQDILNITIKNINYFFIKTSSSDTAVLFSYNHKKNVYVEYRFYNNYIPIRVYQQVDGESTGKGTGECKKVNRTYCLTAFMDAEFKMDITYNGSAKKISSITIFVQQYNLKKANNIITFEVINHYFSIDTQKLSIMEPHAFNTNYYNGLLEINKASSKKNKYSIELAEMFMSSVKVNKTGFDPFTPKGREEVQDFMSIVKMMMI